MMEEQLKNIIDNNTLSTFQVTVISALVSILTFFITNWLKNYFENKQHHRKLETEHKFEQQKKVKDAIAKYKVHLLTACDDVNHRFWNLANNHHKGWLNINCDYNNEEHYYFHTTVYRILNLYAWISKINKEMVYLDTTIASKRDLEFIKFLKLFPAVMCNLTFIVGKDAQGDDAVDHFFRTDFETFPNYISNLDGPKSYIDYKNSIPILQTELRPIYTYIDGISPVENRLRWDRLHLLHLTTIIFLNNYGYDFQKTNNKKLEEILSKAKVSNLTNNFFDLIQEFMLGENKEVKIIQNISKKYHVS